MIFLNRYYLIKLNEDQVHYWNSIIIPKNIEAFIKSVSTTATIAIAMTIKTTTKRASTYSIHIFWKEKNTSKLILWICRDHFLQWTWFLNTQVNTEKVSRNTSKEKKNFTYHNKVSFIPGMQGWCNVWKSIKAFHYINQNKVKKNSHDYLIIRCKSRSGCALSQATGDSQLWSPGPVVAASLHIATRT